VLLLLFMCLHGLCQPRVSHTLSHQLVKLRWFNASCYVLCTVQEAAEKQRQRQLEQEQKEILERPWLARRLQEQQQQQREVSQQQR
jgi:hypothetical protein